MYLISNADRVLTQHIHEYFKVALYTDYGNYQLKEKIND